jgi:hypothetical protein
MEEALTQEGNLNQNSEGTSYKTDEIIEKSNMRGDGWLQYMEKSFPMP